MRERERESTDYIIEQKKEKLESSKAHGTERSGMTKIRA